MEPGAKAAGGEGGRGGIAPPDSVKTASECYYYDLYSDILKQLTPLT